MDQGHLPRAPGYAIQEATVEGSSNGPILVRTSERASFLTCRQQWWWSYVEHLRAQQTTGALVFGDLVHQALAIYYKPGRKRGPAPAGTFERLYTELTEDPEGLWDPDLEGKVSLLELGIDVLTRYVEHWEMIDSEYEVISSEQTFQVPIGKIMGRKVWYVGTIDGVWKHLPSGKLRFAEHKTATEISNAALPMNEQVGAYWAYGPRWLRRKGILKSGEKLDGIIYNWLRKSIKPAADNFDELGRRLNKDGSISKRQPSPYFRRELTFRGQFEADRVHQRVRDQTWDMLVARADPEHNVYKNPGPQFFPNCKFCGFRDMCELHETGNDWQAYRDHAYGTWNPYDAHEKVERR
jgi:Zierdtviridae exonuclease